MRIIKTYIPCIANFAASGGLARDRKMELMAVLTQDESGLYACYIGLVPAGDEEKLTALDGEYAHAVAGSGNKLPYRDIGMFFRGINESEYRR